MLTGVVLVSCPYVEFLGVLLLLKLSPLLEGLEGLLEVLL
jgi:hypothetical protein